MRPCCRVSSTKSWRRSALVASSAFNFDVSSSPALPSRKESTIAPNWSSFIRALSILHFLALILAREALLDAFGKGAVRAGQRDINRVRRLPHPRSNLLAADILVVSQLQNLPRARRQSF